MYAWEGVICILINAPAFSFPENDTNSDFIYFFSCLGGIKTNQI